MTLALTLNPSPSPNPNPNPNPDQVGAALLARAALDGGAAPPEAPGRLEVAQLEAVHAEEARLTRPS